MKRYEVVLYDSSNKLPGFQTIQFSAANKLIARLKIRIMCLKTPLRVVCWNPCVQFNEIFIKEIEKQIKNNKI